MSPLEAIVEGSRRLAVTTKRQYRRVVRAFVGFAGDSPASWTPSACDAWVAQLDVEPRSVSVYIAAVRWASRRWAALNEGARDFAAALENPLVPVAKHPASPPPLERDEIEALLSSCGREDDPADLRDRALLAIAVATGLRRAELAGIEFNDLDPEQRTVVVVAKRNRRHVVRLSPSCWQRLDAWLAWLCRRHVAKTGRVFRALRRSLDAELGWCVGASMSPEAVYRVVRRRARRAGISGRTCAHTLRHTLVATLRARGVPEHEIARRVGHARVETTAGYGGGIVLDATEGLPT